MGRGGYHGGSTIISGGGWSTFDPAAPVGPREPADDEEPIVAKPGKAKPDKPKTREHKKAGKARSVPDLSFQRLEYLGTVIVAELNAEPPPPLPRRARPELKEAVDSAASVMDWARKQPEYATILQVKQRRMAAKHRPASVAPKPEVRPAATPSTLRIVPQATNARVRLELYAERSLLCSRVADAEAEVERCRSRIAEIDRTLTTLTKRR